MIRMKDINLTTIRAKITLLSAGSVLLLAIIGALGLFQLYSLSGNAIQTTEDDYLSMRLLKSTTEVRHFFRSSAAFCLAARCSGDCCLGPPPAGP